MDTPLTPPVPTATVPEPEHTAEKILDMLVNQNRAHAMGIALLIAATGGGNSDLPERFLATGTVNLATVLQQLAKVRYVADIKGYSDILELLDQKLPYRT